MKDLWLLQYFCIICCFLPPSISLVLSPGGMCACSRAPSPPGSGAFALSPWMVMIMHHKNVIYPCMASSFYRYPPKEPL